MLILLQIFFNYTKQRMEFNFLHYNIVGLIERKYEKDFNHFGNISLCEPAYYDN